MSTTSPDARFTTYNPVVPTTVFEAQFPIFANGDLSVFIDGVESNDFTVTASYVEGVSNNAKVIMNSGVTGNVVIVGDRDPRRQNRFGFGPIAPRDLNLAFDTVEGEVQEARRDIDRSVRSEIGEPGYIIDPGLVDGDTPMKQGGRLVPGPNLPNLAASLIAEATAQANRSHDEADRSEAARDIAAGYASDAVSQGNVPIYGTVLGVAALSIPAGINAFRLNGYAAAGDLGGWFMAVEIPNSGTLLPWQVQTNGGTRRWEFRADEANALSFGVKGDGSLNDRDAIYNALMWWRATGYTLRFPAGSYRMASGILLDMSGIAQAGKIIFEGAIKPDPGIGKAITFRNMRGGHVFLRVDGGGQTANYSQADPVGCDEAFRFEGGKGWEATIYGKNYAGRVCRVTKSNDPNEFQGQLVKLSVHVDSSAEKTEAEAARLAAGVGQAFFIDTGSVAFGEILSAVCFWEKYGSVVENTTDVTHHFMETLYRGLTGFELRGVISYWGGSLNLGSELASPPDLLTIKASSTGPSHNVHLKEVFAAAGNIGVNVVQVGTDTLQGISIGVLYSRLNKQQGLVLNACRGFDVTHHSLSDNMGARVIGGSSYGTLRPFYRRSQIEGLEVGSSVFECEFCDGHILDVNQSNTANTPLIRAEGNTNRNYFDRIAYSSARINTVFLLTSGSKHRIRGRSAYNLNNGQLFNELPELFTDVAGWVDKANGSVVIPAGQTSIVVAHGMSVAPNRIFLQPYEPAGGIAKVNGTATSTQFTITIPAAIGSDLRIDWRAQMRYSA